MAKPEIRLKGFEGEWDRESFTNAFRFLKNNSLSRADLNYENGKISNVHYGDVLIKFGEILDVDHSILPYITNSEIADRLDKDNFLQNGDIVFADAAEDNTVGKCSEIQGMRLTDKVVSGLHTIPCRPIRQFEKGYLGYFLNSNSYHDQLLPMIQGTKVCGISKSNLNLTTISYPNNIDEQIALADYFRSLDSLLKSTTKKIASLKQMKQACLVSMFPQAGETTPRVRFKGFEGEWECEPLCNFSKKVTKKNQNLEYKITLTNSAEYGIINQLDFFDHDVSNGDNIGGYYIVENDDFVYNPRISATAPVGPINRNQLGYAGVMSPLYYVFRVHGISKDYLNVFFKTTLWHKFMKDNGNTGARFDRLSITDDVFVQMPISYPKDIQEQQHIASFFTSLDKQISLQEKRLEKLKQIKAACLDKMFV